MFNLRMECWNVDFKMMPFICIILCQINFTIIHVSIFQEPIIPVFQCSIIPLVSEVN
jgi:hypothetical protein